MVCEKSNELMMRYMDGLLDAFDEMNLNKHIELCETCREDFAVYKEMLEGFSLNDSALEITEAPEGFAAAVMERIEGMHIYFPAKVRNRGKAIDNTLAAIWGLAALVFAAGGVMFLLQEQIFAWLDQNGLAAVASALEPFAAFATEFGMSAGNLAHGAIDWIVGYLSAYWLALAVAFGGLVGLATLALRLSPKYAKGYRGHKI